MEGWVERRDRVAILSLAGSLVILGIAVLLDVSSVRLVLGLMIVIASLPMALYYVMDKEAGDRAYSASLFLLVALGGLVLAGASARLAIALAVVIIALAMAISALRRGRG